MRRQHSRRTGLTLAEVAVTIAIVSIAIMGCLQGLERSVLTAAYTRNTRLARELGLLTLGQIEAGLFWDEIDSGLGGSYSEEGYPSFFYEIALGDDTFVDVDTDERNFDSWAYQEEVRQRRLEEDEDYDADADFEADEPYEQVRVKVTFGGVQADQPRELLLEKWVRWDQVYGPNADEARERSADDEG
ncbi:MAG: hypothetical protein ACI8QZ_003313 [Chlamydiales bacterium]|jgi:hypothetical protein